MISKKTLLLFFTIVIFLPILTFAITQYFGQTNILTCPAGLKSCTVKYLVNGNQIGSKNINPGDTFQATITGNCLIKYLDSYQCSGNYLQRLYQNSGCSTVWKNYQNCYYGCSNSACNPKPTTTTTTTQLPSCLNVGLSSGNTIDFGLPDGVNLNQSIYLNQVITPSNHFTIVNTCNNQTGVIFAVQDYSAQIGSGGLCPSSNVLDVDQYMQFSFDNVNWIQVQNLNKNLAFQNWGYYFTMQPQESKDVYVKLTVPSYCLGLWNLNDNSTYLFYSNVLG